jgi:DNA-binding CsgD family transcriptional regulator
MKRRGRPRAPGLTPRETQVLALIRAGRSNREIAEELGISLQGVKYHVTEILGKLGVDSRKAAAGWEPGATRRWGFAPVVVWRSFAEGALAVMSPKVIAAPIGGLLALGIVFGVILTESDEQTAAPAAVLTAEPTATPEVPPICEQTDCMFAREIRTEVSSLEEAAGIATFQPRLPAYIPEGFDESRMMHTRPGPMTAVRADGSWEEGPFAADPYYDTVWAIYTNDEGGRLTVQQGYYQVAPTGWWDIAPEGMRGTVELRGTELRWIKGGRNRLRSGSPTVTEAFDQFRVAGTTAVTSCIGPWVLSRSTPGRSHLVARGVM